ncbi:MAG: hypothetical protein AAGA54_19810 [Myxococcota bacterium]
MKRPHLDPSVWNLVAVATLTAACGADPASSVSEGGGETDGMPEEADSDTGESGETGPSDPSSPGDGPIDDDDYDDSAYDFDYECYDDGDCPPGDECVSSGSYRSRCESFIPPPCSEVAPLSLAHVEYEGGIEPLVVVGRSPGEELIVGPRADAPLEAVVVEASTGLERPFSLQAEGYVAAAVAADLDGDGDDDLVVGTQRGDVLVLESHLQAEDGSFQWFASSSVTSSGWPRLRAVRDADAIVSLYIVQEGRTLVAQGDGAGGFSGPITPAQRELAAPGDVLVGQFDAGPADDLAAATGGTLWISADETRPYQRGVDGEPAFVAADVDGDGLDDLVPVISSSDERSLRVGAVLAGFDGGQVSYARIDTDGSGVRGFASRDVDGDGTADLIALDAQPNRLIVVRNLAEPDAMCVDRHALKTSYEAVVVRPEAALEGAVLLWNEAHVVRVEPG